MFMRCNPHSFNYSAFNYSASSVSPRYLVRGALLIALTIGLSAAQAQIPSSLSSVAGSALPDLSGMGAGNAAGVLGYCTKNKILGGGNASSVMDGLTKKPGVKDSTDYKSGLAGKILPGKGASPLSLDSLPKKTKSQACDMVLKQGKSLL